jgi:YidC/Oxa1 family membrane protein insertase
METKRYILAIVLCFVVLALYQMVFMKNKPAQEAAQPVAQPSAQTPAAAPPAPAPAEKPASAPGEVKPGVSAAPATAPQYPVVGASAEEQVVVETTLFRAVWSNKGATLRSWKLLKQLNEQREPLELVSPRAAEVGRFPFALETQDAEVAQAANAALFRVSSRSLSLRDGERGELKFEYSDGNSIKAEKAFVFYGGAYDFDIRVDVWKDGKKVEPRVVWGPGLSELALVEKRQQFGGGNGIAVLAGDKVYRVAERKYNPEANAFNFAAWAAYEDNYFTALFINTGAPGSALFERQALNEKDAVYFLSVSPPQKGYIGPKEFDRLRALGYQTKKLINFGFFGAIAEILLIAMKWIHRSIPNWGFAIIIITFIVKVIFFPLTYSSTKSMAKMQELQPKIKALRAKYKKAKQDIGQRRQMNEEMMKLYKEHGINPAGGCLPMLIQIPVFWGFFRLLVVAIEFRQSPFILWIRDLSVKDPYYVTPLLMGATQFISQKMTPTTADPSQAKMMLIMPVVMTVFFMNFQSGLVLYWLTNNVLQIGQQYVINQMMAKKKRETHGQRKK